jgi:hypothetical protein
MWVPLFFALEFCVFGCVIVFGFYLICKSFYRIYTYILKILFLNGSNVSVYFDPFSFFNCVSGYGVI